MMPEPPPPTWRKPIGILMLLLGLLVYMGLVAGASGMIARAPVAAKMRKQP